MTFLVVYTAATATLAAAVGAATAAAAIRVSEARRRRAAVEASKRAHPAGRGGRRLRSVGG